jgi:hypothetical protein
MLAGWSAPGAVRLFCVAACLGAAFAQPPARAAEPDAATADPAPAASARIEGFRHARFGMTEQQVRAAIQRDFPAADGRIARATHPRERTTVLSIAVEDVLPGTGPAQISYILGHSSKQLVQVNLVWTSDGRTAARDEAIVAAANALREYFLSQHRAPDEILANRRIADDAILVFRAAQADGRMVLLLLSGVAVAGRTEKEPPPLTLQLSYIRDHVRPDIFRIERGRF